MSRHLDQMINDAELLIKEDSEMKANFDQSIQGTTELLGTMLNHTEAILQREQKLAEFITAADGHQVKLINKLQKLELKLKNQMYTEFIVFSVKLLQLSLLRLAI